MQSGCGAQGSGAGAHDTDTKKRWINFHPYVLVESKVEKFWVSNTKCNVHKTYHEKKKTSEKQKLVLADWLWLTGS